MTALSPVLPIAGKAFRRYTTYRAATLAGLVTNLFFGLVRAYLFVMVSGPRGTFAGYTVGQLLAFTAWTQAIIAFLSVFGGWDLMLAIGSGDIAAELCRPISLFVSWQAADLGRALHGLIFRGATLLAGYALFLPLHLPTSATAWLALLASLFLAELMSFAWRFLVNSVAFWTLQAKGLMSVMYVTGMFLMGFHVPVDVFPAWLQRVAAHTPFPSMVHAPLQIALGRVTAPAGLGLILATQAAWLLVLWAAVAVAWRAGLRRLVIQGG